MPETDAQPDCPIVSFTDERIDMAYWFPTLREIDVPVPESQPLPLERPDDGPPTWDSEFAAEVVENLGGEAFARSGYKSAAIHQSGSYIPNHGLETVDTTLKELVAQHGMMGLPVGEFLWLREYLDVDHCAYARAPLVPEVRAFIRDGEVVCHHPRLEGFDLAPGGDELRERAVDAVERGWERSVETYADRVATAFDGDGWWSVDFIQTVDGEWYCTDMALDGLYDGDQRGREGWQNLSEHASGCEHNLQEKYGDRK